MNLRRQSPMAVEHSNHLGNVLVTVSDRKVPVQNGSTGTVDYYTADVRSTTDYYAFGMEMPERNYSSTDAVNGFNGMRKDNEWIGSDGTIYDFGARMYDARICRFFRTDPAHSGFSFETPYAFAGNTPIWAIDKDGEKIYFVGSAISNEALQAAYNTLVKTPSGLELLLKYETSNTHDIYIQLNDFLPSDNAAGVTLSNIGTSNFPNGKINLNFNNFVNPAEAEAELKGFQGLDVSRSKGAISLISLDKKFWEQTNVTKDKYALAEALYHEIWAHIYAKKGSGDYQHYLYSKTKYGFYTEFTETKTDYDGPMDVNGNMPTITKKEIVRSTSPAFKIMRELLYLKNKNNEKLNPTEQKILKQHNSQSNKSKDKKQKGAKTQSHQNVRYL